MIDKVKMFLDSPLGKELKGQGIGALGRFLISIPTTDMGAKLVSTIAGGAGMIINEKTKKSELLRNAMVHMFYGFADPTASQVRNISRNWNDLVSGLRMGNFNASFNSIIEDPQEIIGAWQQAIPKMGGFFGKLGNGFQRLQRKVKMPSRGRMRLPSIESEVQPQMITSFEEEFIDY